LNIIVPGADSNFLIEMFQLNVTDVSYQTNSKIQNQTPRKNWHKTPRLM